MASEQQANKQDNDEESQTSIPDQLPIKSDSSTSERSSFYEAIKAERIKVVVRKVKSKKRISEGYRPKSRIKKRYFSSGVGITDDNQRICEQEPSPFHYPKDLEVFAHHVMTKAWRHDDRIKELKLKCSQKLSHKGKQQHDLLKRLYVAEPKIEGQKTILDIDPEYFKLIEGRPIPEKLNMREYIDTVRDTLRTKIVTGYREDDIMLIEESLLLEQQIIDTIQENYIKYVNIFEEFLYLDHSSSMKVLRESENAAKAAYEKYREYKAIAKKYGAVRSSLYNSEDKWNNCKMYEKFLYLVSPFSWRKDQQELKAKYETEFEGSINDSMFTEKALTDHQVSLTDLLKEFKEECLENPQPKLYFTDPEQLLDVFRFIELQNLNSLLHSEELAVPLEQVTEGMRRSEELFDEEIVSLQEKIDKLEGGIKWEEERAKYLEDLALKLIENEFKKLVMEDDVLNLEVFVEDVYETRIGPNDANLTMAQMMKAVEHKYREELLTLDKIPSDQLAILEGSCYIEEVAIMRLAEKAAKQVTELERLSYRLNKATAPAYVKIPGRELKKRSPPIEPPRQTTNISRDLTASELEYLEFFTEYCKYTDDPAQYGIDIHQRFRRDESGNKQLVTADSLGDPKDENKVEHVEFKMDKE